MPKPNPQDLTQNPTQNPTEEQDLTQVDPNDPQVDPQDPQDPAANQDDGLFTETVKLPGGEEIVFEAETQEELREKILTSFGEALAKSKQAPTASPSTTVTPAAKQRKQLSKDEEFAIDTEFKSGSAVKGIEKLFELRYGKSIDEVVEAAEKGGDVAHRTERFAREQSAVAKFRNDHPEYVGTPKNEVAFNLYLAGREATPELLNEAYENLNSKGMLEKEESAKPGTANPANPANPNQPEPPPKRRPAGSGLWGRPGAGGSRTPVKKGLSDAEIQKIATEQGSDALLAKLEEDFKAAAGR